MGRALAVCRQCPAMTGDISLGLLLLAALASAELINQVVDQQLDALNALNSRNELGLVEVGPWSGNATEFSRGYLLGVPSLERAGDARRTGDRYSVPLRLGLLVAGFGRVRLAGGPESVLSLSLPQNALHLEFSLGQDCAPRVHTFAFTGLGPPTLEARPPLSQRQADQVVQQLMLFLNSKLKEREPELAANLQIFCW